jgi:hypothetical protein
MRGFARSLIFCSFSGLSSLSAAQISQAAPDCGCYRDEHHANSVMVLSDEQMLQHVDHVEMAPDRMGNHTNLQGVAVFSVAFDKRGHVDCAKALSGHPIAISLLMASLKKWRFKRLEQDGNPIRQCGRLAVKFSIVNGRSTVNLIAASGTAQRRQR